MPAPPTHDGEANGAEAVTGRVDVAAYAGLVPRGIAYLIDCILAFGLFAITQVLLFTPLRGALGIGELWFYSGLNTQLYTLLTISLPIWLYFALMERSAWQATIGKRLLKLRVVTASAGARIRLPQSVLRTLVKLLPWEIAHLTNNLPVPLWYLPEPEFRLGFVVVGVLMGSYIAMVAFTPKKQGPHDLIAGTVLLKRAGSGA